MTDIFKLSNHKDYDWDCPHEGCAAKKGEPCVGVDVHGGLVHFGRRLLRVIHETAAREGKTVAEITERIEAALQRADHNDVDGA